MLANCSWWVGPAFCEAWREMTKIFAKSDNHDILNALYMTDMKAWLENLSEQAIARVAHEFQRALGKYDASPEVKDRVGFLLSELEAAVTLRDGRWGWERWRCILFVYIY